MQATLRGRLKKDEKSGDRVVAGDHVEIVMDAGGGVIDHVETRRSLLARRSPGRRPRIKPIVANVDQVVVVLAAAHPEPRLRMLDRFLVIAESSDLPALVVVNKTDLAAESTEMRGSEIVRNRFRAYASAGYPVLPTSVVSGEGIGELRERLCGRMSVLTGPSGAGKSSLLNTLEPGLHLRIGEVSRAVNKGRHTTVTSRLLPLSCGGYVADTPGLREVGLWNVPAESLDRLFPEFLPYLEHCRFAGGCSHTHEPGCAVLAAVESGDVEPERHASYVSLMEDAASDS